MHEYSIVAALIERVDAELARAGGTHVKRLKVRIGELAGVDVPLLETAFTTFRERTSCRDAELVVEATEARWTCPRCGHVIARGTRLRCPSCDVAARLVEGDEIMLQTIEMEVPDV
jgi:hydrogenase nickel incorporation protein HypA/HybF